MIPSNGMAVPQGQVMIPNYSVFSGTPSHIVNMKSRTSIPNYLAENELKAEEKWYKHDKEMSNFIAKSLTLQKINHYLHRGNEDFTYVSG